MKTKQPGLLHAQCPVGPAVAVSTELTHGKRSTYSRTLCSEAVRGSTGCNWKRQKWISGTARGVSAPRITIVSTPPGLSPSFVHVKAEVQTPTNSVHGRPGLTYPSPSSQQRRDSAPRKEHYPWTEEQEPQEGKSPYNHTPPCRRELHCTCSTRTLVQVLATGRRSREKSRLWKLPQLQPV